MGSASSVATRIAKWGNSAAVRLSATILDQAKLHPDDAVDIVAREGEIVIRGHVPRTTLESLLAEFDPKLHRHELMLDDKPMGSETV